MEVVSKMNDFDKFEFERYIREDIDGRLYWDDLMERVIDGRVISKPFSDFQDGRDGEESEQWSKGYEEGFEIGYNEGYEEGGDNESSAYDDGYSEGYERAKEDFSK